MKKEQDKKELRNLDKLRFKRFGIEENKVLICPRCFENLFQIDIEHFATCPYCEYKFEFNPELEEYLLQPLINVWVNNQTQGVPLNFLELPN